MESEKNKANTQNIDFDAKWLRNSVWKEFTWTRFDSSCDVDGFVMKWWWYGRLWVYLEHMSYIDRAKFNENRLCCENEKRRKCGVCTDAF